jgi:hypothetical protein
MICIGMDAAQKSACIADYCEKHAVKRTYVLSPAKFAFDCSIPGARDVEWDEIIMYRTFYPLLQEIGSDSLVVVNECLRTTNRNDLTYNCIRHFLAQAGHQIVFNWLPAISDAADFMTLFDFDTKSRWKREKFDADFVHENAAVSVIHREPTFSKVDVITDARTKKAYAAEKAKLFAGIEGKDPHTIPRNLHLVGGKARMAAADPAGDYIGRNNRLGHASMAVYKADAYPVAPYIVAEFPHSFLDFADFLALSGQRSVSALVSDLPVDGWYFQRYQEWAERLAGLNACLTPAAALPAAVAA